MSSKRSLWFTSSRSTTMGNQNGHRITFPGVYSCTLDDASGRCDASMPLDTVVDSVLVDQSQRQGVDVSNLKLSASRDILFGLQTDNYWEILWLPLAEGSDDHLTTSGGTAAFRSYFRIPKLVYTDASKGQNCANYYSGDGEAQDQRFAYYELLPVAFSVDENDDVYISWEGYFQDCQDETAASDGLVWSIGVNKVEKSCVARDGVQSFSNCTSPAAIFYRGFVGKDRRLGNGLAFSSSPSGRQLIYLSAINRAYGVDGAMELWVAPSGIFDRPTIVPTPGMPSVTAIQATRIIPDVASINLNLDSNNLPRGFCQTVYDEGVHCFMFRIEDDGKTLNATSSSSKPIVMVSKEQIEESCTMDISVTGGEWWMSSLSTGLEVIWGSDGRPDAVLFGCYGGLSGQGNLTTVLRDGSVVQTLTGAYPGSLLFGVDLARHRDDSVFFWSDDRFNPQGTRYDQPSDVAGGTYEGKQSHTMTIVAVVLGALFILALIQIANMIFCRKCSTTEDAIGPSALQSAKDRKRSDTMARSSRSVASHRSRPSIASHRSKLSVVSHHSKSSVVSHRSRPPSIVSRRSKSSGVSHRSNSDDDIDQKRAPFDEQLDIETGSQSVQNEGEAANRSVASFEKPVGTDIKIATKACSSYDSSDEETCDDDLSVMVEMLHGSQRSKCPSAGDIRRLSNEKLLLKNSIPDSVMILRTSSLKSADGSSQGKLEQTLSIPDESSIRRSIIMTPAGMMLNPLQTQNQMFKSLAEIDIQLKEYATIVEKRVGRQRHPVVPSTKTSQ